MIEKLPCHDEIVYEIQRAIQTFGPPTAQSLMKRRAQVTASNECEFSEGVLQFHLRRDAETQAFDPFKIRCDRQSRWRIAKEKRQARKELKGEILVAQVAYGTDFILQLFLEKP